MQTPPTILLRTLTAVDARPSWRTSVVIGLTATIGAMATMFWLRSAYQIRTLPERVMEWVLLFVSPDALEQGLAQFGAQAKVYALYVAVAGMALILLVLGATLVRFTRSAWALMAAGPVLYLFAMGVIMPVTGAGPFGLDLLQDWRLVNAGYLAVALTFAALLVVGRWVGVCPRPDRSSTGTRRTRERLAASSCRVARVACGGGACHVLARAAWRRRVVKPAAGARSGHAPPRCSRRPAATALPRPAAPAGAVGQAAVATPASQVAAVPTAAAQVAAAPAIAVPATSAPPTPPSAPTAAPTPPPAPTAPSAPVVAAAPAPGLPRPPTLAKQLVRDQDGAAVGGARQAGHARAADHPHRGPLPRHQEPGLGSGSSRRRAGVWRSTAR